MAELCPLSSWSGPEDTPYGPYGNNRCIYSRYHCGYHRDRYGHVFTMFPFQVLRKERVTR